MTRKQAFARIDEARAEQERLWPRNDAQTLSRQYDYWGAHLLVLDEKVARIRSLWYESKKELLAQEFAKVGAIAVRALEEVKQLGSSPSLSQHSMSVPRLSTTSTGSGSSAPSGCSTQEQLRYSEQSSKDDMVTIYLAGAIRDAQLSDDIGWRETLIERIYDKYAGLVSLLNPVGDKTFNPDTHEWKVGGIRTNTKGIVQQDLWSVRQADIVIANLTSMVTGYPSIGTIMEMGAAAGMGGKLIYTILDPNFTGHDNKGMFKLHPFLDAISTEIFDSVDSLWAFLDQHLAMLTGLDPHFGGVVHA